MTAMPLSLRQLDTREAGFEQAFAEFSGQTISANMARQELTLWKDWKGQIGRAHV